MALTLSTATISIKDDGPTSRKSDDQFLSSQVGPFRSGSFQLQTSVNASTLNLFAMAKGSRRLFDAPDANVSSNGAPRIGETTSSTVPPDRATSQLLAEWHGQVVEVLRDTFVAQLKGKHGEAVAGRDEEAVIPIEEVQPDDLDLLAPGAFFRLCISYSVDTYGSHRRITDVVFRRLPAYRRDELEQAQSRGRELARGLRLE